METITNETAIELLQLNNELLQQNNVNQLFIIGFLVSVGVCYLLWRAIKRFL